MGYKDQKSNEYPLEGHIQGPLVIIYNKCDLLLQNEVLSLRKAVRGQILNSQELSRSCKRFVSYMHIYAYTIINGPKVTLFIVTQVVTTLRQL